MLSHPGPSWVNRERMGAAHLVPQEIRAVHGRVQGLFNKTPRESSQDDEKGECE
jgi:hypothetical protein